MTFSLTVPDSGLSLAAVAGICAAAAVGVLLLVAIALYLLNRPVIRKVSIQFCDGKSDSFPRTSSLRLSVSITWCKKKKITSLYTSQSICTNHVFLHTRFRSFNIHSIMIQYIYFLSVRCTFKVHF